MSETRISAVIVTHNHRDDIEACLASLLASSRAPEEIFVADQCSTDGTPDLIRQGFPGTLVLEHGDNAGFALGNNRAFRLVTGDYILLLNPDATVERDTIAALAGTLDSDAKLGAAVPKTVLAGEPRVFNSAGLLVTRIGYACDRGYLELDHGQLDEERDVLAGSGCALLLRADAVSEVGGFDDAFFMYYEDLDLCLRLRLKGNTIRYVPRAVARHNTQVHGRSRRFAEYLDHRNRLRMVAKTFSAPTLLGLAPGIAAYEVRSLAHRIAARRWRDASLRLKAWAWNMAHLPSTLRLRRAIQKSRATPDRAILALMEGYGGSPRIATPVPDYSPTMAETADKESLASVLIMGENEEGLGLGWHGLEHWDGKAFRWSSSYGLAYLRNPSPGSTSTLTLVCRCLRPLACTIQVNDKEPMQLDLEPGTWTRLEESVSEASRVIRVELRTPKPLIPSQDLSASRDQRNLGAGVARLAVESRSEKT